MKITQIVESASAGATSTAAVTTAPTQKSGKTIRRSNKPTDNALDSGNLFGEAAPKGWEGTVKAMKKHKEIDNPWALAHYMKNKGYKSHKKEDMNEASLGDYRTKANKDRALAGMSAAFANSPEAREKAKARFDRRDKGLNRVKARDELARKADQERQMADLVARLPELKSEYEQMRAKYKSLGGSDWQYADREQNLTDREREARSMEGPMNNLWRQIQAAEKAQGVAEGLPQTLRKVVPGYAKREIDKKMDAGKFGKTDADKDANFQRYKKIQDKIKEQGMSEASSPAQQAAIAVSMKKKGQKPKNEDFNGEYDDEAGMAESNLLTALRAVKGLLQTIDEKDNLPEWAQEKIAKAEMMLVGVWDYLQSQKEQGIDPEINEHKKGVRAMKYTTKPRNFVAKNATTGGAGAHKDKKKAAKQGDVKHKKDKEMTYESKLFSKLEKKIK